MLFLVIPNAYISQLSRHDAAVKIELVVRLKLGRDVYMMGLSLFVCP